MKKTLCLLLLAWVLLSFAACHGGSEITASGPPTPAGQSQGDPGDGRQEAQSSSGEQPESSGGQVEVDLTALSSTMVYAEVFNMLAYPEDYEGKIVKMSGKFAVYEDPTTGKIYFSCIVEDATACCQSGIEFVLAGDCSYPSDYPAIGSEITVTGEFQIYYEYNGQLRFVHLVDSSLQ